MTIKQERFDGEQKEDEEHTRRAAASRDSCLPLSPCHAHLRSLLATSSLHLPFLNLSPMPLSCSALGDMFVA
jgi:hypothetical protein